MSGAAILLALGLTAARYLGVHFGWQWHAATLFVVSAACLWLLKATMPPPPEPLRQIPSSGDREADELMARIHKQHQELIDSYPTFRRDMLVVPGLALVPPLIVLLVLRQNYYLSEFRLWHLASLVPLICYLIYRPIRTAITRPPRLE